MYRYVQNREGRRGVICIDMFRAWKGRIGVICIDMFRAKRVGEG